MSDAVNNVNIFFGSEVYKPKITNPIQRKWFAYKPKSGNLSPACGLPMSAFCAVPYSGGYPTGYGRYIDASNSVPMAFTPFSIIRGFTHFAQSGTGFIDNFYNYFLITPHKFPCLVKKEWGAPGYYGVTTTSYSAEVTAGGRYLSYRFTNCKDGLKLFPGYAGMSYPMGKPHKDCPFEYFESGREISISADYGTVKLYFALRFDRDIGISKIKKGLKIDFDGGEVGFTIAYSFVGIGDAKNILENANNFEVCKRSAEQKWNSVLSRIKYDGDDKQMFYTALYNALKKPCIDEGFTAKAFDFATLWDIYKTQLPLIFLAFPEESKRIIEGLNDLWIDGHYTNSRLMESKLYPFCEGQAKCLASISLATARLYGYEEVTNEMGERAVRDVKNAANVPLHKPVVAHNLDVCDGAVAIKNAGFTKDFVDDVEKRNRSIFDKFGVLINAIKDSKFYEGNNKTYSFRVGASTEERLKITDREKLRLALDEFFGFGQSDVKDFYFPQKLLYLGINEYGDKVKRFEGMNNEPDMDAPFMYHMLGEYERCDFIVNACREKFRPTRDGLCGNDDSGGLTSWYVWAALGIYPVAGTDEFLVFSGNSKEAELCLAGATLQIKKQGLATPIFNGEPLVNHRLKVGQIKKGGVLII